MDAAGGSSELSSPSSGGGEQVYVAVGESKATVLWALHKFPKDTAFVLLHVCSQPKLIPIMGARIPASQVQEQELSYLTQETVHEFGEADNKFQHMLRELESVRKQAYEDNYEAEAIREWIDNGHHTSPMTNLELLHRDLLPNHALRSAIQEWLPVALSSHWDTIFLKVCNFFSTSTSVQMSPTEIPIIQSCTPLHKL